MTSLLSTIHVRLIYFVWFPSYSSRVIFFKVVNDVVNKQIKFRVENISYPPVPIERAEDAKPFAPMVVTVSLSSSEL